jgi:predicted TIM-barrel fold metal-dependent hydrolase
MSPTVRPGAGAGPEVIAVPNNTRPSTNGSDVDAPLVVVSGDSHAGPLLVEQLRPYCPKKHLEAFDAFAGEHAKRPSQLDMLDAMLEAKPEMAPIIDKFRRNAKTAGHHDMHERLREMDRDGVAAEVIFHASQNNEPIPFVPGGIDLFFTPTAGDLELVAAGYHIYNRWLADFVSVQPERHVGLAHVPMWDVGLAVEEVEWAAEAGLRGISFPAPRAGIREYDDPAWEPFWSACEAAHMMLATHAGVPLNMASKWAQIEIGGYPSRRGMPMMIVAGVFEQHPELHLVLTELTVRNWWGYTAAELDASWGKLPDLPKPPSEYMRTNVFLGASFPPPDEVRDAIDHGYSDNFIWGRDFPHAEGSYQYQERDDELNMNRTALSHSFAGADPDRAKAMVGENAIRAYHLDGSALADVAVRIAAPTLAEITAGVGEIPDDWFILGIGKHGATPVR